MQMLPILSKTAKVTSVAIDEQFRGYILLVSCIYCSVSQIHNVFDMYRDNSLNTLVCQKRDNATMGHKMLLQTDIEELKD